jgi:hypothetical protein
MIDSGSGQLLTPQGLITYPTIQGGTIIDLAFATDEITERLLCCQVAENLDFSSDHLPISIIFQAQAPKSLVQLSRCWKEANLELAGRLAEQLDTTREIRTETEIEAYASYLSDQIARILEETVPLRRPSRYAQPWWNPQVAAVVQEAKRV